MSGTREMRHRRSNGRRDCSACHTGHFGREMRTGTRRNSGPSSLHPSPERIDKLTFVRQNEDLPGVYQVGIVDLIPVCLKDVDVKPTKSVLLP